MSLEFADAAVWPRLDLQAEHREVFRKENAHVHGMDMLHKRVQKVKKNGHVRKTCPSPTPRKKGIWGSSSIP
jgi:hypothetical protein